MIVYYIADKNGLVKDTGGKSDPKANIFYGAIGSLKKSTDRVSSACTNSEISTK